MILTIYYRAEYERNNARVKSSLGRYMKRKRQSTVEPLLGTLTQFMGLRKINTKGIEQANKVMQMAAIAYNLKKNLKFIQKLARSKGQVMLFYKKQIVGLIRGILSLLKPYEFADKLSTKK